MLSVVTWKWGTKFSAVHVNVLRAALERHLQLPHQLYCVTDDASGLDERIVTVPLPVPLNEQGYLRCRRRMRQYDREWSEQFGPRQLVMDLDVVVVGDLTPILSRAEPIVGWRVGHAQVYSGSFVLLDAGALHGAWAAYSADPLGYPFGRGKGVHVGRGVPSDQAMLNHYLTSRPPIGSWTERDGFVTYYGAWYERLQHLGVGPAHPELPAGARIVVLGSEDLDVLHEARYPWVREHWTTFAAKEQEA